MQRHYAAHTDATSGERPRNCFDLAHQLAVCGGLTGRAIGEGDAVGGCVVERSEEVIEHADIRYFDVGKGTAEH